MRVASPGEQFTGSRICGRKRHLGFLFVGVFDVPLWLQGGFVKGFSVSMAVRRGHLDGSRGQPVQSLAGGAYRA